ncbi:GNAT family N-acetyltransferase [Alkalihalobacillus sp. LMS39]|uniref:GNAT family N-acetyltransferase n=1 Tax=Alkalihalobacillus sp. LMS39 TaxID=2924032 RepID=UPI001FB4472C|nr:GNAT family N-acetyltransferase [Alkalihalobacillus sp. LMS39]UOE95745.1 GNAT family N-acetyltransferase [Alkalihalobacillus sp. LMS39]
MPELEIHTLTKENEAIARAIILEGFLERFGFIDHSFNPDLKDLVNSYTKDGCVFFTGAHHGEIVCTGALQKETNEIVRIARMSVKKECRQRGFAKIMIKHLEQKAKQSGYKNIVLETNRSWESAIHFYKKVGYQIEHIDETQCHFYKKI